MLRGDKNFMHLLHDLSSSLQIIQFSSQFDYSLKLLQLRLSCTKGRKSSKSKSHSLIQAGISRSGICHQTILPTLTFNLYLTYYVNQVVNILLSLNYSNSYDECRGSLVCYTDFFLPI